MEDLFGGIPQGEAQPNVAKQQNAEMPTWECGCGNVDLTIVKRWTMQFCNLWLIGKHVIQLGKLTKLPCGHIYLAKWTSKTNKIIMFPT